GRVITHAQLLRAVWGPGHEQDVEYLRVAARGIRRKLEDEPAAPTLLRNEPGVGYRLMG
ncbi:MAG TPA: helix-turn-helix domain-containing protein, partial [Novosphingobium sp.]|nr:helix-turn-helix domain-containing protein [Novosphingobium sp.]